MAPPIYKGCIRFTLEHYITILAVTICTGRFLLVLWNIFLNIGYVCPDVSIHSWVIKLCPVKEGLFPWYYQALVAGYTDFNRVFSTTLLSNWIFLFLQPVLFEKRISSNKNPGHHYPGDRASKSSLGRHNSKI